MTNETAIVTNPAVSNLISEFTGGSASDIEMMIGIGLVKDSDAVFFQYMGEEQQPQALMLPSGRPLTRLANVRLHSIDIAENVGEFNSTKLNINLQSNQGRVIMLTSGLQTIWSQCVLTSLMGLLNSEVGITQLFTLDTWKGTSKLKPCFAAIRAGGQKVSDQVMYDLLREARGDRDKAKVESIMRGAVAELRGITQVDEVTIDQEDAAREAGF